MISDTIVVEVMFMHKPSKSVTLCKVTLPRLNWKLRKLQNEGMYIVGCYMLESSQKEETDVHGSGEVVAAAH